MKVTHMRKYPANIQATRKRQPSGLVEAEPGDLFGRVVLLGDHGVGKTTVLTSLLGSLGNKLNTERWCPLSITTQFARETKRLVAYIIDTGGQEKYRSLTASYYRGAHGCLILFDVTKQSTFENIEYWLHDLKEYNTQPEIATILVGTKCHVSDDEREVKRERAQKYAENVRLPYMEVSAEQGINVTETFEKLADMIIENLSRQPIMTQVPNTTTLTDTTSQKKFKARCAC